MPAVEMVRACTHQYSHVRTIMLQVHFSTVYTANIATLNFQPTQCNTVRIHDTDNLLFWRNRTQMCTHTLIFLHVWVQKNQSRQLVYAHSYRKCWETRSLKSICALVSGELWMDAAFCSITLKCPVADTHSGVFMIHIFYLHSQVV